MTIFIRYRSLSQVRSDAGVIEALSQSIMGWLGALGALDPSQEHLADFSPGVHQLECGLSLIVLHGVGRRTTRRYWRVEGCSIKGIRCDVSILVSESKGDQYTPEKDWLLVRVATDTQQESNRDIPVLIPPFMEQIVRQELLHDLGTGSVISSPARVIGPDAVPVLAELTLNPAREVPWLIGHVPQGDNSKTWGGVLDRLAASCAGMVGTTLVEEESAAALTAKMGPGLGIPPGHLRLFLPRVDGDDSLDAARHRIVPFGSILDNGKAQDPIAEKEAARTIASLALDGVSEEKLPATIDRVVEEMSGIRGELRARSEGSTGRGGGSDTDWATKNAGAPFRTDDRGPAEGSTISRGPTIASIMDTLRDFLGTSMVDAETAVALKEFVRHHRAEEQLRAKQQEEHDRTRTQVDELRDHSQALLGELKAVEDGARNTRRQLETYRQITLGLKGNFKGIDHAGSLDESPHTMEDLRIRVAGQRDFHGLISLHLTAAEAGDLDRHDRLGRYPTIFWEYILVLVDYAKATRSGWTSGLKSYLGDPEVPGRKVPSELLDHIVAEGLTNGYGSRECAVPESLASNGRLVMHDVLKSSRRLRDAPVAYFYDDTGGPTGMVHIGHIGVV